MTIHRTTGQLTEAERIAETFGIILGAAINFEQVAGDRANSVEVRMKSVVVALADDEADAEAATTRFAEGIEAGKVAADAGTVEPRAVEIALQEVEEKLQN
jgi:hypothetical protein